jgi:hypothetical protein
MEDLFPECFPHAFYHDLSLSAALPLPRQLCGDLHYQFTENAEEELLLIARLKDAQIHTVIERVQLEPLDVGGGAHPPLLVSAIAEPYGAAQAGSIEQQQEQRQRARHAAACEQERCME